jgi:hypothetical protein
MPRGVYVRSPFCPQGHDKRKPHGVYIRIQHRNGKVYIYDACAECDRNRQRKEPHAQPQP